ncbi:hypothetical protein C1646_776481 [Rhizophagus diaphanus]|nr:hypothetical protein C1646_776481 [Rhizophagus diaphanus] [Rhizophagus sp. MUCL 43196]
MDYRYAANTSASSRSPCTFFVDWRYLIPLLSASQFSLLNFHNIINYNIFDIFDFAKKKYYLLQRTLMQNHMISLNLQDNIILNLLDSSTSRNDLLKIQRILVPFDNNNYHLF